MTIRILLVDDHLNVRRGLRKILAQSSEMEVVGETGNGEQALILNDELNPDLMVLDVEMPGMKGYEVAREMQISGSPTPILALSGYNEKHYILGMFASGAVGYLTKDEAPEQLLSAVEEVASGRRGWLSPRAAEVLGIARQAPRQETTPALTQLEKEVLLRMKDGKSDPVISRELEVDPLLVLESVRSLMQKLRAKSRFEAVLHALQENIV